MSARSVQLSIITLIGLGALAAAALLANGTVGSGLGVRIRESDRVAASGPGGRVTEGLVQADSIEDFTAEHGEPPDATWGRIRIPAISVDAPISYRLVTGDMPDPSGPSDVAYYDMSRFPNLGGRPGEGKNAIFAGHVDLNREIPYARAHYQGPAVFWSLDGLHPGHTLEIETGGKTYKYRVVSTEDLPADYGDWASLWSSKVDKETVTLFTCGGAFDPDTHEYTRRHVVRAERMS